MAQFSLVAIIYNPHSTGSGEALARELQAQLATAAPRQKVALYQTERAGHGSELAHRIAKAEPNPLIIAASGDGGYHEVINGIMAAQHEGAHAVAGLLPAGNANDHFHSLHSEDVVAAICRGDKQVVDLLKLTAMSGGKPLERYAHSYVGIGLTPQVGRELNRRTLNWLNEIGIVLKVLVGLRPVRVIVAGRSVAYDSLIFSNISKMSKVLSLSPSSSPRDGKFEVTEFRRRNKLRLIASLLRASTTGLAGGMATRRFEFRTIKPLLIQLDGEISAIDPSSAVVVSIEQSALRCII